jgi:nucleoid DNA-binding protein
MSKLGWPTRAALFSALSLAACLTAPAQTIKIGPRPPDKTKASLESRIATISNIPEENVVRVLRALGPAVSERINHGETVEIPGLGVFRVARVEEHKDLVNGRPATIPAINYVEFLPAGALNDAANSEKAVPAVSVPGFEYVPIPNEARGLRTENTRTPGIRTR